MLLDKLPKERIALIGLAAILVAAASYALVKGQHRPAPIIIQGISATKPVVEAPAPQKNQANPAKEPAQEVVVHAAGAVKKPGLLHLSPGSRVDDAVKAAGGPTQDADLEAINLAAKLEDGTQVFVPRTGSSPNQVAEAYQGGTVAEAYAPRQHSQEASEPPHGRAKKDPPAHPINLNSATFEQLQQIPGVGPSTAQKILDYRHEHGSFGSIDELTAVPGIGEKKLDSMRRYLKL